MNDFTVNVLNEAGLAHVQALGDQYAALLEYVDEILCQQPSRLRSLVVTKLQEAWLVSREAIAQMPEYRHGALGGAL